MAGAATALPTRSQIEAWETAHLGAAARRWTSTAELWDQTFEALHQEALAPGGTQFDGATAAATRQRTLSDKLTVIRIAEDLVAAAAAARTGADSVAAAKSAAVAAIARAEDAGFDVGEDLSLTSRREFTEAEFDAKLAEAQWLAAEIRTAAAGLVTADAGVAAAVTTAVASFAEVSFPEPSPPAEAPRDPAIRPVNNEIPKDEPKPVEGDETEPTTGENRPEIPQSLEDLMVPGAAGNAPAEESDGADPEQPEDLDEALSTVAGAPVGAPQSVVERLKDQMKGAGKGDPSQDAATYTESPLAAPIVAADPSVVEDQAARVDAARQAVAAAQAELDSAAVQGYVQGPGGGPGRDTTDALSHALFDARRNLTEQTRILEELGQARTDLGGQPVSIPTLPANADVQAFPPAPSAFAEGSRALSEGSFGLIPDVAHDIEVLRNWGEHSGADQAGVLLDLAGMVPLPGGKAVSEALQQGLDALSTGARHVDDIPGGAHHSLDTPDGPAVDAPTPQAPDSDYLARLGVEDTAALLEASESAGGHLISSHVAQSVEDLSTRLDTYPRLKAVSSFETADEAAAAVSAALQHNQRAVDRWIAEGAIDKLRLDAKFSGGMVMERDASEALVGTHVKLVLKGDGTGGWYVLTGFPTR